MNEKTRTTTPSIDHTLPDAATKLIGVGDVAEQLDCSERHVYRLADSGRMPKPVKLGALVRWNQQVITEWISEGCPRIQTVRV